MNGLSTTRGPSRRSPASQFGRCARRGVRAERAAVPAPAGAPPRAERFPVV